MSDVVIPHQGGQVRLRRPRVRTGHTTRFAVDDQKGYLTTTENPDGSVDEVTIKVAKQGSTLAGVMDALSTVISLGLQAGAPLDEYVGAFANTRFVPAGITDDPELPVASSMADYVARRLAVDYLPAERRMELGVLTAAERRQQAGGADEWPSDMTALAMSAPIEAR